MLTVKRIFISLLVVLSILSVVGCADSNHREGTITTEMPEVTQKVEKDETEAITEGSNSTESIETTQKPEEDETEVATEGSNSTESIETTQKPEEDETKVATEGSDSTEATEMKENTTTEETINMKDNQRVKLTVMGKDITGDNEIVIGEDGKQTKLPFVSILEALGAKFAWDNPTTATIEFKGKEYLLDSKSCTLVQKGDNFNLLIPAPGGKRYYHAMNYELILDSGTIYSVFTLEGLGLKIIEHPDKKLVEIK